MRKLQRGREDIKLFKGLKVVFTKLNCFLVLREINLYINTYLEHCYYKLKHLVIRCLNEF